MAHVGAGSIPEWQQDGQLPPPPGVDSEAGQVRVESNFRGLSEIQKWEKEDWMKKGALALILRAVALLFSFLSFVLVVQFRGFKNSSQLSYLFSIALIVMAYTAAFVGIKGHELRTRKVVIPDNIAVWIEFIGDQLLAVLFISSVSSAATAVRLYDTPGTRALPKGPSFIGRWNGAVAMGFLGYMSLQSATLLSGYNLALHLSKS